jgi:predicted metal-dependent hydrolase
VRDPQAGAVMQIDLPFADSAPALPIPPALPAPPAPARLLSLVFVRHPRARRYVIRVADDGRVRVTIPRWGSKREAQAFAERERVWIEKQWQRLERSEGREGQEGQESLEAQTRERLQQQRELIARAKCELPPRLLELAAQHGLTVTKISVRNQKWRWGSCSPTGHICLNWRLAQMPDAVRDYVLIHELMHLKRMDHSPKFWKLVALACPDYRELRRQLREMPRV